MKGVVAVACWRFFIVFEPIKPIKDPTGKCDSIRVCCKWIHPILYFYSNDIPLFAIRLVSVCLFVCLFVCFSFVVVQFIVCLNYFLFILSKDPQTRTRRQRTVLNSLRQGSRDDLNSLTEGLPHSLSTGYGFLKALRVTGSTILNVYVTTKAG